MKSCQAYYPRHADDSSQNSQFLGGTVSCEEGILARANGKPGDEWTISLASNLLQIRLGNRKLDGFTYDKVEELLHYICTN